MRMRKRRFCSSSVIENQYLIRTMPERTSSRSNSGTDWKKSSYSSSVQKPITLFDAGAVVPAAVEQHDLAAGRQMRDVALEVPLAALALGRRRQRHGAADARVETLRDPLDDAAFARRVPPLEDDDQLELVGDDPVLELDELALQPQQLLEIEPPRQRIVHLKMFGLKKQVGELVVLELKLDILVEVVLDLGVDALLELAGGSLLFRGHCRWLPVAPSPRSPAARAKCSTTHATILRQAPGSASHHGVRVSR